MGGRGVSGEVRGGGRGVGRRGGRGTLPALYWVTLCWVCFLHSLPLQ